MQIDRHIIDFLQWIHDLLWLRKKKHPEQVVEKIGTTLHSRYGYIQQIRRHLPPEIPDRDISAWMFMPLRGETKRVDTQDYYIVCLFLGAITGFTPLGEHPKAKKRRRSLEPTHRIIVVTASRWLNSWEGFESKLIYTGDHDLQGRSEFINRDAAAITRELVMTLRHRPIEEVDWKAEIEILRKIQSLNGN